MKIVHVCDGWERTNGAANIARLIAGEQAESGASVVFRRWAGIGELKTADEVWIHCGWMPCLWWATLWAKKAMWVPEACYDPFRLRYHGWKKWLVGPIERWALRRCACIKATCAAEADWVRAYEPRVRRVEVVDVKKYFRLGEANADGGQGLRERRTVHLLYLGRRHPLKGVEYLERAVDECNRMIEQSNSPRIELRLVSNARGEEKERVWNWCDVLCLPTLSDNFGLVVAEALERGKRVIVTDGAPAWEGSDYGGMLRYVKGYRDGDDELRVRLLKQALFALVNN